MKALMEWATEYPLFALLIVGTVCTSAVEIVAIIVLHHPIAFNAF